MLSRLQSTGLYFQLEECLDDSQMYVVRIPGYSIHQDGLLGQRVLQVMEAGKHQMEEPELGRYWGQRLVREVC